MDSNESDKLGLLLDPEYQSHIIEVIKEWCGEKPSKKSSLRADLVDKEISKPLQAWIAERANGELPHLNGLEAAHELYIKTNDIVYILRYQTRPLYPEHVSLLNDALAQFQRSITSGLYFHNRMLERTLEVTLKNQRNIESAIDEELHRRAEQEAKKREIIKQQGRKNWQAAGVNAARKYTQSDRKKWLAVARVLLKENRHINSVRKLAEGIQKKLGYCFGAEETIRKDRSIINIYKKQSYEKNIG